MKVLLMAAVALVLAGCGEHVAERAGSSIQALGLEPVFVVDEEEHGARPVRARHHAGDGIGHEALAELQVGRRVLVGAERGR
ncbi:MAG TPA: hypothetical protein VF331_08575 [Polyangiales bacterium]